MKKATVFFFCFLSSTISLAEQNQKQGGNAQRSPASENSCDNKEIHQLKAEIAKQKQINLDMKSRLDTIEKVVRARLRR